MAINIIGKLFFGGSVSLDWLDQGLDAAGLSAAGFPEPLRLAMVRLTKSALDLPQRGEPKGPAAQPLIEALHRSGWLFAYCYVGSKDFADRHGADEAAAQQARLAAAADAPDGLDARIVSLALVSGFAHPEIAEAYDADLDEDDRA